MDLQHGDSLSRVIDSHGTVVYSGPRSKATEMYIRMSIMTRKHFQAVATTLAEIKPDPSATSKMMVWDEVVENLCGAYTKMNPHFNEEKFKKTCGYVPQPSVGSRF